MINSFKILKLSNLKHIKLMYFIFKKIPEIAEVSSLKTPVKKHQPAENKMVSKILNLQVHQRRHGTFTSFSQV